MIERMRKSNKALIFVLSSLLFFFSASSYGTPFQVNVGKKLVTFPFTHHVYEVIITSLSNNLSITNLRLNEGNCQYSTDGISYKNGKWVRDTFPWNIKYGDKAKFIANCNPIKITVSTNEGDYDFSPSS